MMSESKRKRDPQSSGPGRPDRLSRGGRPRPDRADDRPAEPADDRGGDVPQPDRRFADVPVLGRRRPGQRLAPGPPGEPGGRRRRDGDGRGDLGLARGPDHARRPRDLGRSAVEPLARIVRFLESQNTVPAIQLAHAGRKASCAAPFDGGAAACARGGGGVAGRRPQPRAVPRRRRDPRRARARGDRAVVEDFVAATRRAVRAGFRVIELHMAHGYLLHSFLSPLSNHRSDEYGGSFENRVRLPLEVVAAVKAELPPWSPLFVRISATDWVEGGWDLEQSVALRPRLLPGRGQDDRRLLGRAGPARQDPRRARLPGPVRGDHPPRERRSGPPPSG